MAAYTHVDLMNYPASANQEIDSGVASAPYDRPSTFTPPAGYVATGATVDSGVATTPAVRPLNFERSSLTATVDPGLVASG